VKAALPINTELIWAEFTPAEIALGVRFRDEAMRAGVGDSSEVVVHSADAFAPVAYLRLLKLHLEDKASTTFQC
ncbi:hypothetical protein lerEdw1_017346, partial [Lerista edwardsae]